MTRFKPIALALAVVLLGAALASPAQAHGSRTRAQIGLSIGLPLGWPYWGYPYAYHPFYYRPYQPSVVVVPAEPTVYRERPSARSAPETAGTWYYCASAGAYYPYVRECSEGWQRVAPRPPGE